MTYNVSNGTLILTGTVLHCTALYSTILCIRWQFAVVVMHWSELTKLLYAGPS